MAEQKEPRHLLVFRILGFLLLFGGITLVILGAVVFREEWGFHGETIINSKLFTPGMFASFLFLHCLLDSLLKLQRHQLQVKNIFSNQLRKI